MKNSSQEVFDSEARRQLVNGGSKFKAMLHCKCPVCKEGDMFRSTATDLGNFNELNKKCKECGYGFMPEPGFYQISMFFTYMVGVAIFVVFGFLTYLVFNDPPLWVYYATIFIPTILSAPWNLRYSKVVMLYYFGDSESFK